MIRHINLLYQSQAFSVEQESRKSFPFLFKKISSLLMHFGWFSGTCECIGIPLLNNKTAHIFHIVRVLKMSVRRFNMRGVSMSSFFSVPFVESIPVGSILISLNYLSLFQGDLLVKPFSTCTLTWSMWQIYYLLRRLPVQSISRVASILSRVAWSLNKCSLGVQYTPLC